MKCATCDDILDVDRDAVSCQCGDCALHRALPPRRETPDPSTQLELGEVAVVISLPANYLHCIEALVGFMRQEGTTYLSVSDGNHVYRISEMGRSVQIQITATAQPVSTPEFLKVLAKEMEDAKS